MKPRLLQMNLTRWLVYERLMLDGDAQENWQQALVEMRLSLVEHTMD